MVLNGRFPLHDRDETTSRYMIGMRQHHVTSLWTLSVPDDGYTRNALFALKWISTVL
jgi:hypothetical protein